jgi:DNA-binding LacI/PurR family transcriptional regulator
MLSGQSLLFATRCMTELPTMTMKSEPPPQNFDSAERPMPSVADIAEHLGLSKSTVSRALRGLACISEATRHRVRTAADELGYRPNPFVSALMLNLKSKRQVPYNGIIAILDTLAGPTVWKDIGVHRHFHSGACRKAQALGFAVERHWCGDQKATSAGRELTRRLLARGVHGILIPPLFDRGGLEAQVPIDFREFSCVTLGFRMPSPSFCFSLNDQYSTAQLAFQSLHERGLRRIGLAIPEHTDVITNQLFRQGYRSAAEQAKQKDTERLIFVYKEANPKTEAQFQAWLKRCALDAVIGFNPVLLTWAKKLGLSIPGDIAFGFMDLDWDRDDLSGIEQNSHLVAFHALDMLVQLIYRNEKGACENPYGVMVEGFWRDGKTAPSLAIGPS